MNGVFSIPPATLAHYAKKRAEGEDHPVAVGALHVNKVNGPVLDGLQFVDEASRSREQSGDDQVVTVGQLQNLDHHLMLDHLERFALDGGLPLVDQPLVHRWTPGLYVRQITNPAGSLVTTEIHKTEHPFFVLQGVVTVRGPEGTREIVAPFSGITMPGTRRLIFAGRLDAHGEPCETADVVWVTVHAITPEEEAEPDEEIRIGMIRDRIIERREESDGRTRHEIFRERLAAPLPGATAEEIYGTLEAAAEMAYRAAGSPSEIPINREAGRQMAERLARRGDGK